MSKPHKISLTTLCLAGLGLIALTACGGAGSRNAAAPNAPMDITAAYDFTNEQQATPINMTDGGKVAADDLWADVAAILEGRTHNGVNARRR